eukprot:3989170-Alexandrium_andersonii.AAC.1
MSASLVGSEMCIRDRLTIPCETCAMTAGSERAARRSPARRGRARAGKAVSYTHLTLPTICSV